MEVECSQFAKKLAATTSHREGAYSRTGEPSATFYERGGAAAGARSNMAKVAEMNISFRAIKISQSTKVNCDIGNGTLPLAEKEDTKKTVKTQNFRTSEKNCIAKAHSEGDVPFII